MLKLVVLFSLAAVVCGQFNVKMNELLDGQLAIVTASLSRAKLHNVPLGDKTVQSVVIKGMALGDIATLQRIGDATLQALDDSTMQSKSTIGLKNMVLYVEDYASPKVNFQNASFTIQNNALTCTYTVAFTATGGCSVVINDLEITELDGVTMHSSDPKMNGIDVTQQFQTVKQNINQYFKSPAFQNLLAPYNPCKSSSGMSNFLALVA